MTSSTVTIDARRLARAIWLDCERMDLSRYLVEGGSAPHVVQDDVCDCADAGRGNVCKHRLRVLLDQLAPEILAVLRLLVAHPKPA